jgi:hypothetical protein
MNAQERGIAVEPSRTRRRRKRKRKPAIWERGLTGTGGWGGADRARKDGRAAEKVAKADAEAARKAELRELQRKEEEALAGKAKAKKVTQADIAVDKQAREAELERQRAAQELAKKRIAVPGELEANENKVSWRGGGGEARVAPRAGARCGARPRATRLTRWLAI